MADVAPSFGTLSQVAIIARLRARIFRNSIRTTSARLDLVAFLLVGALVAFLALGIGMGMAFGAYFALTTGKLALLNFLFWGIFLAWHVLPILFASFTVGFDFRNLLRFPLRFLAFYLLSLAYSLFDPALLSCLFWLICLGAGAAFARPDLFPAILLVVMVFAATNLLLGRLISSWLERLLARRRAREALIALFLLSMFSLQLFGVAGQRWGNEAGPLRVKLAPLLSPLLRPFPPGLASSSIEQAAQGNALPTLAPVALLAAYGVLFAWLLRRRLLAQYRGEDLSESLAPSRPSVPSAFRPAPVSSASSASFASFILPPPVAAMFEKEVRYILRNSILLLTMVAPVLFLIVLLSAGQSPRPGKRSVMPITSSDFLFPGAVAYAVLIFTNLLHNCFGYAGYGIQLLLAAPVRFRDILLGVNLAQTALVLFETALITLFYSFFFHPPALLMLLATLAMLCFLLLVNLSAGNLLSLYRPRRIEFGSMRRQQASGLTVLIGLGIQLASLLLITLIFLATYFFGGTWLALLVFLVLAAATAQLYRTVLDRCTRIALDRREFLTAEFCRSS